MPARLSVNLNAIAYLRNRRAVPWPDIAELGEIALTAGAAGLTVHPRPDRRHIRPEDLPVLRGLIDDKFPDAEFNMEGYPDREFLRLVFDSEPEQVTLVPDDPEQSTSDHGWNFDENRQFLEPIIAELKRKNMRVSLFADPSPDGLQTAKDMGADRIELYTGPYGGLADAPEQAATECEKLRQAAHIAQTLGLGVNAGHDLTVNNLPPLVAAIPHLAEVSIGHGLIADALKYGMGESVKRFLTALNPI